MIDKSSTAKRLLLDRNCYRCLYGYRILDPETSEHKYLCLSRAQGNGEYEDISSDYTCPEFYDGRA